MGWKENVSGYFKFSQKDRLGVLALLLIIVIIYFLPKLFPSKMNETAVTQDSGISRLIDTLEHRENKKDRYANYEDERVNAYQQSKQADFTQGALFDFDPNTLSFEGWQRLGLSDKTAGTIQKYVSKGGHFYKPEDLKKIWGLPKGFYERVAPYIRIKGKSNDVAFKPNYTPTTTYNRTERRITAIDVNAADTSALIALPGIGSKLAYRITNFRDKLGGFHSVEQIKETYGLPDSTFEKIKPYLNATAASVRKFNVNTATKDELKMHPYIKWNLANAIVEYRAQHGAFKSLSDLRNIMLIDDATFEKIVPYLSLQ